MNETYPSGENWEEQCARLEAENKRLREALEKIAKFGRPLEAPKASYAVCEINDIAKEALNERTV